MDYGYYDLLGLSVNATPEEIHCAYRDKARDYHPDSHPQNITESEKKRRTELFKRCANAFDLLSNPVKRATYDANYIKVRKPKPKPQKPKKANKNKIYPHNDGPYPHNNGIITSVDRSNSPLSGDQGGHKWNDSFAGKYESDKEIITPVRKRRWKPARSNFIDP